jgi:hypothetical protein
MQLTRVGLAENVIKPPGSSCFDVVLVKTDILGDIDVAHQRLNIWRILLVGNSRLWIVVMREDPDILIGGSISVFEIVGRRPSLGSLLVVACSLKDMIAVDCMANGRLPFRFRLCVCLRRPFVSSRSNWLFGSAEN